MKKIVLTAIGLLVAGSASAADLGARPLPVKAAPAPVAVAYNWTGCYIGAGGGYGMFDQETGYQINGTPIGIAVENAGRGWFGTVQVGCDYQVGSNIVIGAFADYDFSDISGTMSAAAFSGGSLVGDEKLKSSWAAGGRIGWLPFAAQNLLVYVSGGYTQARFDAVNLVLIGGGATNAALAKHTYDGWFLGSGYEYQLGFFPGLTWKTEYRFADYGADNVQLLVGGAPIAGAYLNSHKYVQTVRSDLVWRFNFGGPVVARY
jgi:outer membrane immunogenic protein